MNGYSLAILAFYVSKVSADIASVTLKGCYKMPSPSPSSPINIIDLQANITKERCISYAASINAQAFGIRLHTASNSTGYCYYGPLASFTAFTSVSTVPNCDVNCPGTPTSYPCGWANPSGFGYTTVVYSVAYCTCCNTSWSAWSSCSQTCGYGVRNRYQILNNGTGCISTKTYEYESCNNSASCEAASTAKTPLKSLCASSLNGYYAYSSCYFFANVSGNGSTVCSALGAELATLFGTDLVSQLGSVFLKSSSVIGLTSLQTVSGSLKWMFNGTSYPFLSNETVATPAASCVSLVSNINSSGGLAEVPHLAYTACSSAQIRPICMKYDYIYSSYVYTAGIKITEILQSTESATTESDVHACGARCSRIISCLGFNYRSTDRSCIPTKVSYRTSMAVSGNQVYSITNDPEWAFYDRI